MNDSMFKGLARSPLNPRPNGGNSTTSVTPIAKEPEAPLAPSPPPPPSPVRAREITAEADSAAVKYENLKKHIHNRLVDRLDMNRVGEMDPTSLRAEIRGVVEHLCDTEDPLLNRHERQKLVEEILDETFGLGPLEILLKDDKIGDIMINGPKYVFIEKAGRILRSDVHLPRQRAPASDHRPDRLARRPAGGRDLADGGRPAPQRLPCQRDHPTPGPRRSGGHDPHVRLQAA